MAEDQIGAHANIRCRTIIEILGKPKEHVEQTIKGYVEKIKSDNDYVVLSENFSEPEEQEQELWSVFVELEMLAKGVYKLNRFCFDYMPSSLEIVKPDELQLTAHNLNDLYNDLQARLHRVDQVVKEGKNENEFLRKNLRAAIRNVVLVTLKQSHLSLPDLSKVTGVHEEQLQTFVSELEEEDKITKDGEIYRLKTEEA